jgi:UDP-N-acetylmuramoyl-tripeptide--D-alanyl-D-alanine ligase
MERNMSIDKLYSVYKNCNQKISTDTRKIITGSVFFALKGTNFNANEFASEAIKQGCKYAIIDEEKYYLNEQTILVEDVLSSLQELAKYHRQTLKYPIIGITGSNAKTTHKELIHTVLSKKYKTYATKGNLNNHIGVPLSILELDETYEFAIIEMGANHQGEIALLSSISDPDFGVITNIGKAHLEGFGGVEGIKKGKGELYKHIIAKKGKIFINADDLVLLDLANGIEQIRYGTNKDFFVHGQMVDAGNKVAFKWNTTGKDLNNQEIVETQMYGHYNFINMLCATCIGKYFKVDDKDINDALRNYIPEMNRSQTKFTNYNTLILDAYNANPSSMKIAIDNFHRLNTNNEKTLILGDMFELGEFAEEEHVQILKQLEHLKFKKAYLVGSEFFKQKINYPNYQYFQNTKDLCSFLKTHVQINNIILIKGSRGMKLEQVVELL